jgi:large subunit ribosomal protein L14e
MKPLPCVGRACYSIAGRDKGRRFLIVREEEDAVYVVDGDLRKMAAPKKKNIKHIRLEPVVFHELVEKLMAEAVIGDAEIRNWLSRKTEDL